MTGITSTYAFSVMFNYVCIKQTFLKMNASFSSTLYIGFHLFHSQHIKTENV